MYALISVDIWKKNVRYDDNTERLQYLVSFLIVFKAKLNEIS